MSQQTSLVELLQVLQRPINCLQDQDRNIKKSGLTIIEETLFTKPVSLIVQTFERTALYRNLCCVMNDSVQKHRETSLRILRRYLELIKGQPNVNLDVIDQFLKTLIRRVSTTPFAETCEQLRLEVVRMFGMFKKYPQQVVAHMADLTTALAKCLSDSFPDLKKQCCVVINEFSADNTLRFKIGHHGTSIVKALANNLPHQHAAVRRVSVQSLGNILTTESCGHNFEHVRQAIQGVSLNKSLEVRRAAFECVAKLLNRFSVKLLSSFEPDLVGILLNGLSDQSQEIVELVKTLLDDCGSKIMELEQGSSKIQIEQ